MNIYYASLDVVLEEPLSMTGEDGTTLSELPIVGFIMQIGCSADSEVEMHQLVEEYVRDACEELSYTIKYDRVDLIDEPDVKAEIYGDTDICDSLKQDPLLKGVWYSTGRAFYRDGEDDEDEFYRVELVEEE